MDGASADRRARVVAWGTAALLFVLPMGTQWIIRAPIVGGASWEFGTVRVYATEALLWVLAAIFVIAKFKFKIVDLRNGTAHMARIKNQIVHTQNVGFLFCALFIIYIFFSIGWAFDRVLALQAAARFLEAGALFFLIKSAMTHLGHQRVVGAFVAGVLLSGAFGLFQFFTQSTFSSSIMGIAEHPAVQRGSAVVETVDRRWLRAYGTFPHPNLMGGYAALAIVVLFLLPVRFGDAHTLQTAIRAIAVCLLTGILFVTFSRSAFLACIAGVFLTAWYGGRRWWRGGGRRYIACIVFVALGATLLFWPLVISRGTIGGRLEEKSLFERRRGYGDAYALFVAHPWRGVGIGNYTAALRVLYPERTGSMLEPAHNVFLIFMVEVGLLGVAALGIGTAALFRLYRTHLSPFGIVGITLLTIGMFDHYLWSLWQGLALVAVSFGVFFSNSAQKVEIVN